MSPEPDALAIEAAKLFEDRVRALLWALAEDSWDLGANSELDTDHLEPIVDTAWDAFGDALGAWGFFFSGEDPGRDTAAGACGGSP